MGHISKLLVANRGEIAVRVMRTARLLDVRTVAVFSDADAEALHVGAADEAVRLPGESPADTYLQIDRIVGAALTAGADAVHPGYGFLSERAELARACAAAGLVFVGPDPDTIDAMGSKTTAKAIMSAAGVPVLPDITLDEGVLVDDAVLDRAATKVGFPLLVKAAYGGGGRGMRIVRSPGELREALASAQREAELAFGNGAVFLERYLETARHIEVQILGDRFGSLVHLFERECSIQRRYQKIVEESPSPAIDDALRTALGDAALKAGSAIGYVNAGTVEFVLDAEGSFFFLEVNTRLQVEHPVTELVTGLDLVALQLLVAEGRPLPASATAPSRTGHAIEARLYAEDVAAGFLPATGTIHRFDVPDLPGIRVDAGVATGSVVGIHYDPMLAKVIAHGEDRDDARRRLAAALAGTRLHGVRSNRDLLVGILREEDFQEGSFDTGYLERHEPAGLARSGRSRDVVAVHAFAAALAGAAERRAAAPVLASMPMGWRNVDNGSQQTTYLTDGVPIDVRYRVQRRRASATVNDVTFESVGIVSLTPERTVLEIGGLRRSIDVHRVGPTAYVDSALGTSVLVEQERFPEPEDARTEGSLLAPMPGTIARIVAVPGQQVDAGDVVMVLEAMKMEHTVVSPTAGTLTEVAVRVGQTVDVGTMLAVVTDDTVTDDAGSNR